MLKKIIPASKALRKGLPLQNIRSHTLSELISLILLLTLTLTISACSPEKNTQLQGVEWARTFPDSVFLTASAFQEEFSETKNHATKNFRTGEERTVYAGKALLTVSSEKEQIITLPYIRVKEDKKLAYIAPKTIYDSTASKKVQFLELNKNLTYPLFALTPLLTEQKEETETEETEIDEANKTDTEQEKSTDYPASPHYALVGDIFIGLNEDLSLSDSLYLYHKLEFVPLERSENTEKNKAETIQFLPVTKSKKTALSENNYSIVYVGKNGNILQFRKVYRNAGKSAEYAEYKMTSPEMQVFGHSILVQTATREALHCIIQK